VPFVADQHFFWGGQVYQRGVSPRPLSRRLSVETLAAAIEVAVTDAGIVARAKELGERMRAEDGVGGAVEAALTVFSGSTPVIHRRSRPASVGGS
jgi:sterol 3beta-glucosyltransferase